MKPVRVKLRPRLLPRRMNESQRRWLVKVARSQFWRVAPWYELDDLIQDGFLCYAKVLRKYPRIHNPAHLGKLFQVTYQNHIHTLANRRRHSITELHLDDLVAPIAEPWEHPLVDAFSLDWAREAQPA